MITSISNIIIYNNTMIYILFYVFHMIKQNLHLINIYINILYGLLQYGQNATDKVYLSNSFKPE